MKLKPIHGFDFFLVLLSRKVPIYTKTGDEISQAEIARTSFGVVKLNMDKEYYWYENQRRKSQRTN